MCYGRGRVHKFNVMKRTQNVTPALLAFRTNQKSGGSGHGLPSPLLIGITRITSRLRCTRKCDCSITTDNWTGSGFALRLVHNVQPIGWSYSRVLPAGHRRICSAACGAWANQCPNHDDGRESRRRSTRPSYPALRFRRRDGSGLPSKLQNDVADFAGAPNGAGEISTSACRLTPQIRTTTASRSTRGRTRSLRDRRPTPCSSNRPGQHQTPNA
jgi:hypothetical protein